MVIGSLALFLILSGFSGLRTFNYALLNASDPDLKIEIVKGKFFELSDSIKTVLYNEKAIESYSKVVEERVFLKHKDKQHIATIKGVDEMYPNVVAVDSSLVVGTWIDSEFKNTAVIGNGISFKLSLGIYNFGEVLEIFVPKPGSGYLNPNNAFNTIECQVIGVYDGTEDFRNKYVFTELKLAQHLLNYPKDNISSIELKLREDVSPHTVKKRLQEHLGKGFEVNTRQELNALYYKVINTENFISYLIFTLIVVIALFNVIGAIIMMIIDKRNNLKTLFKLGASIQDIKNIFVLQGFLLTVIGMLVGLSLGIILVVLQQKFSLIMITQSIPYPVEFKLENLLIVMATILVLGFAAAKLASSRITTRFIDA